MKDKAEPNFTISKTIQGFDTAEAFDVLWIRSRSVDQDFSQMISGWAGRVTSTGNLNDGEEQISVVDYMAPINVPSTEISTVQKILKSSLQHYLIALPDHLQLADKFSDI